MARHRGLPRLRRLRRLVRPRHVADHEPVRGDLDALNGAGKCGNVPAGSTAYPDRCGHGPRQPLLVISPYAKANYVDYAPTEQTSILSFIEDNWHLGRIGDQSFDARAGPIGKCSTSTPSQARAEALPRPGDRPVVRTRRSPPDPDPDRAPPPR